MQISFCKDGPNRRAEEQQSTKDMTRLSAKSIARRQNAGTLVLFLSVCPFIFKVYFLFGFFGFFNLRAV